VRDILGSTVQFTGCREGYIKLEELPADADFFTFQKRLIPCVDIVPSHRVINTHIRRYGRDYRFEVAPNPIPALRDRCRDNTDVGRVPCAAQSTDFKCNC